MKKSELRQIVREEVRRVREAKDLGDVPGSVANSIKKDLNKIAGMVNSQGKLKSFMETLIGKSSASEEYTRKFFLALDSKKSGQARLFYITNVMLAGMGEAVIK